MLWNTQWTRYAYDVRQRNDDEHAICYIHAAFAHKDMLARKLNSRLENIEIL